MAKARTRKPRNADTERTKTSVSLVPDAKYKLAHLKAQLRRDGLGVTESELLEALIMHTDAPTLARLLKSR
jgi:hypothetical protein